jgi:predicted amidohydrolase YtcJ
MQTKSLQPATTADFIVVDAKITTSAADGNDARALAVKDELFLAVGDEPEVMRVRGEDTQVVARTAAQIMGA